MHADELDTVADSLERDIIVAGPGAVTERITADDQLRVLSPEATDDFECAVGQAAVLVVPVDTADTAALARRAADRVDGFVVAVLSDHDNAPIDPSLLESVRDAVDVTVFASRNRPPGVDSSDGAASATVAAHGAADFVRMLRRPGHINLDLADARTVLTDGSLAALARGRASFRTESTDTAVHRAFDAIPDAIEMDRTANALVSVIGGPAMSINDAVAAVRAVRGEIGDTDEIIWGVATDDGMAEQVAVDVVIDDVAYRPSLSAGDPCRRCGEGLSVYTFGDRTTIACPACGFADLSYYRL